MTEPTVVLPDATPAKPRHAGVIATAIAVPVLLVAGGAYAYQQLNGGGAQPADVMPSTVVAYARLDADPSASQKIKLFKLIRKTPDLAKEIGIKTDKQDLRKNIVEGILSDCDNVDYTKDIKPWIGDRIGIGVTDLRAGKGLVAVQVSDEKGARKGIDLAAGCLGFTHPGVAFSKGYALIGNSQDDVDAAVKAAKAKTLAADVAFTEDMQSLGDQGVASVWVRADAFIKEFAGSIPDETTRKQLENARSTAFALRAGDDDIELAVIGHRNSDLGSPASVNLGDLPAGSVFAASFAGGGKGIGEQWDTLRNDFAGEFNSQAEGSGVPQISDAEIDKFLKSFEDNTGFALPEDLETLFGDDFTFVVGDSHLEALDSLEGPADVAKLDAAISMRSTSTAATDLAQRIAKQVAKISGIELAVVSTDKGAVLATNENFAKHFRSGKHLGDTDEFASVIDDEKSVGGGLFIDIAKIIKTARGMDLAPADRSDLDQMKHLKALGFSATKDGDRVIRGTLKLSFN